MTTVLREPEQERLYTFKLHLWPISKANFVVRIFNCFKPFRKKPNPRRGTAIYPREECFVTLLNVERTTQETNTSQLQYREYVYAYCC